MRHLIKKNPWECLVTAFAMALNVPVQELFDAVGHDGSEVIEEHAAEPLGRRGFHIQELIDVALGMGKTVTPFELAPVSLVNGQEYYIGLREPRFTNLISGSGVLVGHGGRCQHAVAFSEGRVFDPDGPTYDFALQACEAYQFFPQSAWIVK